MTVSRWVRSRLFRSYLWAFVLLWLVAKGAMAVGAVVADDPPLAFHPLGEALACAIELWVVALFIRRAHEDILLANLGLALGGALAPLVPVHAGLSLALAVLV